MFNAYPNLMDRIWFGLGFIIMVWVAANPDSFIRAITFGRSTSADVSQVILRTTRWIAGLAALAVAITFVVSQFTKAR
jgi:hypothetical protein